MASVSLKTLLEAGVHFGHRTKRWNPKMKPYIFTERNGVHIIDLQQTVTELDRAYDYVRTLVSQNGNVLFVGTKRQAAEIIAEEARRSGMPFVNQRWLGGTLTNFRTIRSRVEYMNELERRRDYGEFARLPKKEVLKLNETIERLNQRVGGLRDLERLPEALFIVDVRREELAVKEASKLGIPIIAIVDTNCDPDPVKFVIPSNDDAIRAIKLMVGKMSEAALEGTALRQTLEAEAEDDAEAQETEAERAERRARGYERERTIDELLGPSTLAKLEEGIGTDEEGYALAEKQVEQAALAAQAARAIQVAQAAQDALAAAATSADEIPADEIEVDDATA